MEKILDAKMKKIYQPYAKQKFDEFHHVILNDNGEPKINKMVLELYDLLKGRDPNAMLFHKKMEESYEQSIREGSSFIVEWDESIKILPI